jgi:A/G-specific adenine glycosylase
VTQYNGVFPDTYEDILKLKGVGEYTAAAIASFAYNKVHAVVDGNVYRLLARVFGIDTPIDSGKGKSEFRELAAELIDSKQPGTYNQAIMEFGGRYCKPRNPDCENCIFAGICVAKEKGLVHSLPVKASKTKVRDRHFQYLFIRYKGKTWLKKRGAKDIWQGLYDFPLIETEERIDEVRLKKNPEWKAYFKNNTPFVVDHSSEFKHLLSHQRIYATFWVIDVASAPVVEGWTMTPASKLHTFAVPRLMDLYLSQ